ncbi:sulfite exporter TauE/SafE family protein [Halobellus sp. Atlit-31R]|nr:sulfite exporter TauE/SafE family protein [Halobellus sp. Atlit-31R]
MVVDATQAALVVLAVGLGGVVTGVNGFGFAVVGTSLLASAFDPGQAVTVMILPILAANVSLAGELDRSGLRSCVTRFWTYVAAAAAGTVLGMIGLSLIPTAPLVTGLGAFVLAYVAFSQDAVRIPGESRLRGWCFRETDGLKAGLGFVSGVVFGASNVGVQVVAYLRSLDLDRATFVGVVAMVFLGVGTIRVLAAAFLGLYEGGGQFVVSAAAIVPGLAGVSVGRRLRTVVPLGPQRAATFALLTVVGVRLLLSGLGGL